jgi:hypothetical protein
MTIMIPADVYVAAEAALNGKDVPRSYADRVVDAVYPLIVQHIADQCRANGPHTYWDQDNYSLKQSYGEFVEGLLK